MVIYFLFTYFVYLSHSIDLLEKSFINEHKNHVCNHGKVKFKTRILEGLPKYSSTIKSEKLRMEVNESPEFKPIRIHFDLESNFYYFK